MTGKKVVPHGKSKHMNLRDPATGEYHTVFLDAERCMFSIDGGPTRKPRVAAQREEFYELAEFEKLILMCLWDFEGRQRDQDGNFIAAGDYLYDK